MAQGKLVDYSEEDLKAKVVLPWLSDHGFTSDMISLEKSFRVRLGRGVFRVDGGRLLSTETHEQALAACAQPRVDVLVRASDGRNLMVIEVKAPEHDLTSDDRNQAISYARVLEGNIAPFAVLTNGRETQVYDVLTAQPIRGEATHPISQTRWVSATQWGCSLNPTWAGALLPLSIWERGVQMSGPNSRVHTGRHSGLAAPLALIPSETPLFFGA